MGWVGGTADPCPDAGGAADPHLASAVPQAGPGGTRPPLGLTRTVERNGVPHMPNRILVNLGISLVGVAMASVVVAFSPVTARAPENGVVVLNTPYQSALSDVAVASDPSVVANSCKGNGCKVCVSIGDAFCAPTTVPSHCHRSHPLGGCS